MPPGSVGKNWDLEIISFEVDSFWAPEPVVLGEFHVLQCPLHVENRLLRHSDLWRRRQKNHRLSAGFTNSLKSVKSRNLQQKANELRTTAR